MAIKNLAEFEYLIRKTITYLDFHGDDSARELRQKWQQVLQQIQQMKQQKTQPKPRPD